MLIFMKSSLKNISLLLVLLSFFSSCQEKKVDKQPNIVYILADDLGYGDVSVYNQASKISTPNIDGLAEQDAFY